MRSGAAYREALRDGRRVWLMGEGLIEDLATHPATRGMTEAYAAWYDRHADPGWQDTLMVPARRGGERMPYAGLVPRGAEDLRGMGRCISATTFLKAGNNTHTPAYGHLIALRIETTMRAYGRFPQQTEAAAAAYRRSIAESGRILTFCSGAATIGYRLRKGLAECGALRVAMLKARQGSTETLRVLPGSSVVVAPTDLDLASPKVGAGVVESFGGGGFTALQRSALLQMASDHAVRRWMRGSWRSSCAPMAASPPGAGGCARVSAVGMSWRMRRRSGRWC
ncbi:MAG: 4-hydroxyphenylacetate 3-hydroxylase N-terminal domain-containing protein [Rhodopila sp.]